jgi:hypothetical protein
MAEFDATIIADWGDGEHRFRLGLAQLLELQEKTGVGPMELFFRVRSMRWRVEDITETLRLGLVGGGLKPADAVALVRRYGPGARPLAESVPLVVEILAAAIVVPEAPPEGNGEAETETGVSPPPPFSDAAPS